MKEAHLRNPSKWNHYDTNGNLIKKLSGICSKEWKRNNSVKFKNVIEQIVATRKENIKIGKMKPSFLGRKHTIESRQKISNSMGCKNNGLIKTKYYSIFCPYLNKEIKVQGTWELKYATYLNENNIKWVKTRNKNLRFKFKEDDYSHFYYPDFYLIDSEEYIEIKGYYWKSKDGRVDDRLKMKKVIECNPNLKIIILEKIDLEKLGIKL
jgi:hypothetical protein